MNGGAKVVARVFSRQRLWIISDQVGTAFKERAKRLHRLSVFVKIALLGLGSAAVAIAQFVQASDLGRGLSIVAVVGIAASLIVFAGAVFTIYADDGGDRTQELEGARAALEEVRRLHEDRVRLIERNSELRQNLDRLIQLFSELNLTRQVIEQALVGPQRNPLKIIDAIMQAARTPLPSALDIEQGEHWTVCVYQAHQRTDGRMELRCAAHLRSIDCPISKARRWQEGVGVAGVAYAKGAEVIVPDMNDVALGTVFNMEPRLTRPYDYERYRSLAAVPIRVGSDARPWGVVIATSDQAGHFETDQDPSVRTVEAVRALAGMIELGIAVSRLAPPMPVET